MRAIKDVTKGNQNKLRDLKVRLATISFVFIIPRMAEKQYQQ